MGVVFFFNSLPGKQVVTLKRRLEMDPALYPVADTELKCFFLQFQIQ